MKKNGIIAKTLPQRENIFISKIKIMLYSNGKHLLQLLGIKKRIIKKQAEEEIFKVFIPTEFRVLGYMDVSQYSRPHVYGKRKGELIIQHEKNLKKQRNRTEKQLENLETLSISSTTEGLLVLENSERQMNTTETEQQYIQPLIPSLSTEKVWDNKENERKGSFKKQKKAEQEKHKQKIQYFRSIGGSLDKESIRNLEKIRYGIKENSDKEL